MPARLQVPDGDRIIRSRETGIRRSWYYQHARLIEVEQEGGVVAAGFVGAVLLPNARRAVVLVPGLDAGSMERIDLLARARDEGDVHRPARRLARHDDEVRQLRAPVAFPERRYAEWLENGLVERDTRLQVAHTDLDVVDDDTCPVPVHAHGSTLPENSLTGEHVFV